MRGVIRPPISSFFDYPKPSWRRIFLGILSKNIEFWSNLWAFLFKFWFLLILAPMATRDRTVKFRNSRDAVESVRASLPSSSSSSSSSAAAAASGGLDIWKASASLLGPNRSFYTPFSTEEPGPSRSRYAYPFLSWTFKGFRFLIRTKRFLNYCPFRFHPNSQYWG